MNKLSASVLIVAGLVGNLTRAQVPVAVIAPKTDIPYVDARPILETLREDLVPAELRSKTPAERASAWPGWVARREAEIRARLTRGDEDSVLNFLLFGTTFTKLPRATERDLESLAGRPGEAVALFRGRIDDFAAGVASPGSNERLQFARQVIQAKGIDPSSKVGEEQLGGYLAEGLTRVSTEIASYNRAIVSANLVSDPRAGLVDRLTIFRERGLSSDTSIFVDHAIEQALEALKGKGLLGPDSVRRVAIVGPGLDFTNKHDGYDFYPQQTIQPFAVIDSLIRLGLAMPGDLRMTTLDLSSRVNQHLEAARQQAGTGSPYILELPRNMDQPWNSGLVAYWQRFGDAIGEIVTAVPAPPGTGSVQVRAVGVRPEIVLSITPVDLNIVLQWLGPVDGVPSDDRFDLIIATDVLIYYDIFEQSLALANVAKMLRPGGFFLTNNPVFELPATPMSQIGYADVIYMKLPGIGESGDRIVWFRRE